MSLSQAGHARQPKKKGLLGSIFCCGAPEVEASDGRPQTATQREAKPALSQAQEDTIHKSPIGPVSGENTTEDEKVVDESLTALTRNDSTELQANTPEILPAVQPTSTNLQSSSSIGTNGRERGEEQAALEDDEPLTPSSNAIASIVPVAEVLEEPTPIKTFNDYDARWLLPALSSGLTGKKCLVLDLDETLVHSSFKADFVVPVEIDGIFHNVYVIKRPGVDEFMKCMGEHFEIVVFTASLAKYADPVLDMLDIHRVVHHRLFRESCFNHMGNYVKDLSQLGRNLKSVVIIDNSPASYVFHPAHAVPISSWFNDVHDTELVDLIPFLIDLKTVNDVSEVLDLSIPN